MDSISRPVFIAGPARSGTSLLLSILSKATELWSPYRELHGIYEWDIGLAPDFTEHPNGTSGRNDNVLTEKHVTPSRRTAVAGSLFRESFNIELLNTTHSVGPTYHLLRGVSRAWKYGRGGPLRILDKNPKHCFRIPFLKSLFPDAQFVFLYRRPEANISSLIEGWKSGQYATYQVPRSGESFQWHFDLPPGWDELLEMSLPERCAHQWVGYNRALLRAEQRLSDEAVARCRYEDMVKRPLKTARALCSSLDVRMSDPIREHCEELPVVNSVSAPDPEKWRKREQIILDLQSIYDPVAEEIGYAPVE